MDSNKALGIVEKTLKVKRFNHTLRVAETAEKLANRYGVEVKKAKLSAILHDYAKYRDRSEMQRWILNSYLPKDLLDYHHEIWHGPVGAIMLEAEHGLTDRDVLQAIACHTTGKAHMSPLDLILYVADYIEPGRDFPGVDSVREAAEESLLHASWMISRNTVQYLSSKGVTIYPDSIHAYNDLTVKMSMEGFNLYGK